jgi:P-type Ca2+ transporter type 2C
MLKTNVVEQTPPATEVVSSDQPWHTLGIDQTLKKLEVQPSMGLTDSEALVRREKYGENELSDSEKINPLKMVLEQLTDPLVLILLGAATVSFFLGETKSVVAIMAIVVLNAMIGVSQEYRAEQAMAALKKMAAPSVRVRRNGQEQDIPSVDLVPGDIVLLEAGSVVPADGRVIESASLQVQEASLTGESIPVEKSIRALENTDAPIGDRSNMVYMGTAVTNGRSTVAIVNTGMQTELGRIASLIQNVEGDKTPLQKRMAEMGKALFYLAIGIVVLATIVGLINRQPNESLANIFIAAVAMAVAVVPEGLPAVVTISLALGAQRMLRRKALIRKLPAVETLGSVTTICSDKTGTLTENRMTVTVLDVANQTDSLSQIYVNQEGKRVFPIVDGKLTPIGQTEAILLTAAELCNDASFAKEGGQPVGDPTETALLVAGASFDVWKGDLEAHLPRVGEVPFSSERKRMSTVHQIRQQPRVYVEGGSAEFLPVNEAKYVAFAKGAVDSMLDISTHVVVEGAIIPLSEEWRGRIETQNDNLAQQGLRVLGFGFRPMDSQPEEDTIEAIERDFVFAGMIGMIDPPRAEVKEAVARSHQAGINVKMITGDHPLTAFTIARDLNIVPADSAIEKTTRETILTGRQLSVMSDEELETAVKQVSVYARVSPEHKLRIVRALQKNGEIVSMTGDGVNDAPALKQADIGVAMGITGTAVSKEASEMVILDDNFATIVSAAEEGRTIYDNVRKFIKYILGSNIGEVCVLFATQLLGMPLPLNTLQILWMNLVTDGLPALALSVEQGEPNAMSRPPRSPKDSVFSDGLGAYLPRIGFVIFLIGILTALLFPIARENGETLTYAQIVFGGVPYSAPTAEGLALWSTMVFTTLVVAQMGHALAIRSERDPIWKIGYGSNIAMLGAIGLTVGLQLVLIYVPFMNDFFGTRPLAFEHLLIAYSAALVTYLYVELDKMLIERRRYRTPLTKR